MHAMGSSVRFVQGPTKTLTLFDESYEFEVRIYALDQRALLALYHRTVLWAEAEHVGGTLV